MTTTTATTFTLTDQTEGKSWDYATEAKLKTATRLYAFSHPKAPLVRS